MHAALWLVDEESELHELQHAALWLVVDEESELHELQHAALWLVDEESELHVERHVELHEDEAARCPENDAGGPKKRSTTDRRLTGSRLAPAGAPLASSS